MNARVSIYQVDHREVVQDMRPLEAVEYLLGIIEEAIDPPDPAVAWTMPGVALSPQQKRALRVLAAGRGGVVTNDTLIKAIRADHATEAHTRAVTVMICKLRQALSGLPVSITNVWGQGYALSVPIDWCWPWENAQ